MSAAIFPVDMERFVERSDSYTHPDPPVKATVDPKLINGLVSGTIETQHNPRSVVIVCSEKNKDAACTFQESLSPKGNTNVSTSILCCKGPEDLSASMIHVPSLRSLYLLVDRQLYNTLVTERSSLHDSVYDFMKGFGQSGKYVYVFDQIDGDDEETKTLFYQLPPKCRKWCSDIRVNIGSKEDVKDKELESDVLSIDPSTMSDDNSNILYSGRNEMDTDEVLNEATNKLSLLDDESEKDQTDKKSHFEDEIMAACGDVSMEQTVRSLEETNKTRPLESIIEKDVTSRTQTLLSAAPRQMKALGRVDIICGQQQTNVKSLNGTVPIGNPVLEEVGGRSDDMVEELQAVPVKDSEDDEDVPQTLMPVQIGSHCNMNIHWSDGQSVIAKQEGHDNVFKINIVPQNTNSKTILVVTTNPSDPALDQLLVKEIDDQREVINISMKSQDASIVRVYNGSIILEIEVKPGQKMDNEWLKTLLKTVFNDRVSSVLPEGTVLNVDIESKMVIPIDQLGQYILLNQEDLHKNCVSKEEYDQKVKEVQMLEKRLNSVLLNQEDLHKNYVSKEEYDKKVIEVQMLEKRLNSVCWDTEDLHKNYIRNFVYDKKVIEVRMLEKRPKSVLFNQLEEDLHKNYVSKEEYDEKVIEVQMQEKRPKSEDVRALEVKGIPEGLSKDALEMYFENRRRSGGGEVKAIDRLSPDTAIIYFEDDEVLESVAAREHILSRHTLTVSIIHRRK